MRPTKGETKRNAGVSRGDGLVQAKQQRQVAVKPSFSSTSAAQCLPCGGDLDEDALAAMPALSYSAMISRLLDGGFVSYESARLLPLKRGRERWPELLPKATAKRLNAKFATSLSGRCRQALSSLPAARHPRSAGNRHLRRKPQSAKG